ncbi:hypothetical protein C1H46_002838 [Malus baccata]|uniref:Phosphoacetylglucosamine mutase AMG1 domain-containing protein n=1 Tax=Malus baccata TaxID=106549 RepID=A0A540NLE1_MALBA|nr:hypothetical protein C1H46_002838 [Malus baccata]
MLNGLAIEIRSCGKEGGVLNEGAGAGYVQKEKVAPCSFGSQDVGIRCASLDDDTDRLGIYFEANGHGTILFSEHYLSRLEARAAELSHVAKGSEQHKAALRLVDVKVVDRAAVVTANAETVAVTPPGIQEAIDAKTEAFTDSAADSPASSIAKLVDQFLGFGSS